MKLSFKYILLIIFAFVHCQVNGQNPVIQGIVNKVNSDSIFNNIAKLEVMERFTKANDRQCSYYIKGYLDRLKFDTTYYQEYKRDAQDLLPNIIAVKWGTKFPDTIFIIGAHYDSYKLGAPAADDNASGISGLLEAARIISEYKFSNTLMFVFFSGEELGYWGSTAFVDSALNNNFKISGMLNVDMISYLNDGFDMEVVVRVVTNSNALMNKYLNSSSKYVPEILCVVDSTSVRVRASDHASFWLKDIQALGLGETGYLTGNANPYYHSDDDILGLSANSPELATLITKTAVATLMELSELDTTVNVYEDDKSYFNGIKIYPNPAKDYVFIHMNNLIKDQLRIAIYDIYGQKLFSSDYVDEKKMIDISTYTVGVYLIEVTGHNFNRIIKIIKE